MILETEWRRLVDDYEAAGRDSDAASAEADAVGFHDPAYPLADARHEALRRVFETCEDDLLDVVAPNLDGVAYQLKVFAERFHSAVLDEPMAGEYLRHILAGLLAHRG